MRVTAIMNLKGGTAKTVTAINMAAILARDYAMRVLLVDADSQANLTEFVTTSLPDGVTPGGFADLLRGLGAFPLPTKLKDVKILHADESLMELDVTAARTAVANPMALADYLAQRKVSDIYDWVVIDCPPAFSAGAMAALAAADDVVIPMKIDAFGIRGMANLLEQIRNMRRINADLELAGVLPTMFYPMDSQREAEQKLKDALVAARIRMFHHIRRSTKVDDMTFAQQPLIYSSPKSVATRDYKLFVRDMVRLAGLDEDAEGGEV